ncbi:co-chaperone GroES [Allofustis seminis]|uniref:co-chaperone GroES n=1 Tax=Allofustis seminis TaxID=166939 RepID=UPI00035E7250|nr:co-chaperone GroES [Allofustis seminis]
MLKPLGNRVILEMIEEESKTASGIVLPNAAKEKTYFGKVIAVGQGQRLDDGTLLSPEVKVGDTVVYEKFAGNPVTYDGADYLVIAADDLVAVVE